MGLLSSQRRPPADNDAIMRANQSGFDQPHFLALDVSRLVIVPTENRAPVWSRHFFELVSRRLQSKP
jgi:hypothetical protein